ncbi:methionine--tRNA ligase subunit beta [Candidatus Pacearchaeota archaeon]|nr:MAG: methionine--tRNA ligase subunit beta [Candidatus Pacearchaeota archaeon]
MEKVSFKEFQKLDLRVGEIVDVSDHPNADKLFVMKVDLGEGELRTIVAGLKGHYSADELKGKKAVFVANLEPAKLRGIESDGMILAAVTEGESEVVIISPEKEMPIGARVT